MYVLLMMGGVTTRNIQSSLQKYNKLYIDASCWTIIDIAQRLIYHCDLFSETVLLMKAMRKHSFVYAAFIFVCNACEDCANKWGLFILKTAKYNLNYCR